MANIKDSVENDNISLDARAAVVQPLTTRCVVDSKPDPAPKVKVNQESQLESSVSQLKSHFVGMGFSARIVDKVLQKKGEDDANAILESLLSHCALQKSSSESYLKRKNKSGSRSCLEFSSESSLKRKKNSGSRSQLEFGKVVNQEMKSGPEDSSKKRSYLLENMNFPERAVGMAFNQLGKTAPLDQLIDYIVRDQNGSPTNQEKVEDLFGAMDKSDSLLQMGFTKKEISSAIDTFGPEVSVCELADSIFASRIAGSIEKKEVSIRSDFLGNTEAEYLSYHVSSLNARHYDDDDIVRVKKGKNIFIDDNRASSILNGNPQLSTSVRGYSANSMDQSFVNKELDMMAPGRRADVCGAVVNPPYFLYGNVIEISKDTWGKLSPFLFSVEPELVNSKQFSALFRAEGYIHNLPTKGRHAASPKSPMTIGDALPFTRQCWPSWDARKYINAVHKEAIDIEQTCERLESVMKDSGGVLSSEQQRDISHQCWAANLIWMGKDKLRPLEPCQMEHILGYPPYHTQISGLNGLERLIAMKYAFQTDTLAYLLSVLKDKYPNGLRVLSIYSGVGGAEIALHRLGIPLKCVISVESSNVNRRILKGWWAKTKQVGQLRQLDGIRRITTRTLEDLVKEFGGFDLVIGGNPGDYTGVGTINGLMGMDSSLFFEFVRVVRGVRSIVGSKN